MNPKIKERQWSKDFEPELYKSWKAKKLYKFNKSSKKSVYSIDTPPPYVNAPVHIGQATTYVLMDMFARFKRMIGYNVLFPLGLDRNGLPIEMAAEKRFSLDITKTPRKKYIKACRKILEESSSASTDTFLRSGISFNSWQPGDEIGSVYETDSESYRSLTQETFIDLYNKNLLYEDKRITNYCPGCKTTLADAEVEYKNLSTFFNDIVFKVKETGENVTIGTTRPELVCTCGMVIFNPKDKRWAHLKGKTAITPLFNKEVPIKPHPMAEIEKGTGLVMMCSAGDTSDIRFFREMNLKPVIAINKDGRMNEHAGFLNGLKIKDSRDLMIEKLKEKNLLVKQEKVVHRTPVCERSKDPIEFIEMSEIYCKQLDFKKDLLRIADNLNFYAPQSKQILVDWINGLALDWPVSRRRYYATEVPLWYCKNCSHVIVPKKGPYYQPWKSRPPVKKCPSCGSKEFVGDERVFDTWFDSSISPLYILKYSRDDSFFKKNFPCSLRPQGKEIVRTWLYYTLLKDYLLTNKTVFKDVWINYHILDEKGHKMSKSLGNVINPKDVLDRFGAEPFRLWAAVEGNLEKTDFRCSFERIEAAGKTLVKLWNVARFISAFPEPKKPSKLSDIDRLILNELNSLVEFSRKRFEDYDFHNPVIKLRHFIWETFASHYLELVKSRAYNSEKAFSRIEQDAARYTLYHCLKTLLRLLAPVLPFITCKIYKNLYKKEVHFEGFPEKRKMSKLNFTTKDIVRLNSSIWKKKKDRGLSLRSEIKELTIPENLKSIKNDIQITHNAKTINFGKLKVVLQ